MINGQLAFLYYHYLKRLKIIRSSTVDILHYKSTMNIDFLNDLNPSQREAVMYNEGASLVIAGAGSGKTRVLTYKIAYLLQSGFQPSQILALTFTNKAAKEMKSRIAKLVDSKLASRLWMGTFHSVFLRILRTEADRIGFTSNLTVYDSSDSKSLIRSILKEKQLDEKIYKPNTVQGRISMAKNALITPTAYASDKEIVENDEYQKMPLLKDVYRTYMRRCKEANAMDFDDLLLYTNILFRDNPDVTERYRSHFQYILVDEYQDTNFAQHLIVKQLSMNHGRVFVVGDDAQSIYSFRGANIDNILSFRNGFSQCRLFKLEQNYRSTQNIVNAANSLIRKNRNQIPKEVFSTNGEGDRIRIYGTFSDVEEGYLVSNKIAEMHLSEHCSYDEFAILYRTNAQSRIMEESLRKRGIPYRVYGGLSFYQRKEIKDVVAYLRLIVNPQDEEALKRVINYPTRGIGATTLDKIRECANSLERSLWEVLCNPIESGLQINSGTAAKLKKFQEIIETLREKDQSENAYQIVESTLKGTGILADLFSDTTTEGISKQQNVQELLNGANDFVTSRLEEGNPALSLTDFLSEISLATDQDSDDEDDKPRVTMMTIHAAKGLEFCNVFIVGMEEDLFPSIMAKQSEREMEEERRLFYVALTRAEKRCALSYSRSRFRNGQTTLSNPSSFIRDIDPKYVQIEGEVGNSPFARQQNHYGGWNAEEEAFLGSRKVRDDNRWSQYSNRPLAGNEKARSSTNKLSNDPIPISSSSRKLTRIDPSDPTPGKVHSSGSYGVKIGQIIQHERFGIGEVLSLEDSGDNAKMIVRFENAGEKKLLLKFVKFTIIE